MEKVQRDFYVDTWLLQFQLNEHLLPLSKMKGPDSLVIKYTLANPN